MMFICLPLWAAETPSPDDTAIRKLIQAFSQAEHHRDSKSLGQLFTAAGEISIGNRLIAKGRDQIEKSLSSKRPWSELIGPGYTIQRITLLKQDTATADAKRVYFGPVLKHSSSCNFALVKEHSNWRISSYRLSPEDGGTQDPAFSEPPAAPPR